MQGECDISFTIIIDGPNFINSLTRHGKDSDYIMNFSFPTFRRTIQAQLKQLGLSHQTFKGTDFVCSNKKQLGPFTGRGRAKFIEKLKREQGVSVIEVNLSTPNSGHEKGVDTTVITQMFEASENLGRKCEIILVASDRDYIPPTRVLRRWGCHVINVAFDDAFHSPDQINESFMFFDLKDILERMEGARVERSQVVPPEP